MSVFNNILGAIGVQSPFGGQAAQAPALDQQAGNTPELENLARQNGFSNYAQMSAFYKARTRENPTVQQGMPAPPVTDADQRRKNAEVTAPEVKKPQNMFNQLASIIGKAMGGF